MTEEIIVDGVNAAGCEFAVKPINDNRIKCHCVKGLLQINKMYEQPMKGLCKDNPNCYYKQLKRLEQENKELEKQLSSTKCYLCGEGFLTPEGAELYLENKQMKSALEEIRNIIQNYESKEWNCFNDMDIKLEEISKIINEVLE